jgi:equilibrative nucleoside transporter 1/2/3
MGYFQHMLQAHKEVYPCDILILLNYIQTFMLFPALSFSRTFSFPGAWPVAILTFSYALGDTAGKGFCSIRYLFNEKSIIYVFFSRFYFFWTIIMLSKPDLADPLLNSDAFAYINMFFFAFSNGIITSKSYSIFRR